MSNESNKWDNQWSTLLTHCHGADVECDAGFKSSLLAELKARTARHLDAQTKADEADADNWSRLLKAAYVPCHPEQQFQNSLLDSMKAKQKKLAQTTGQTEDSADSTVDFTATTAPVTMSGADTTATRPNHEEDTFRTLLTHSYEPVAPRKEFETRLLLNLKERQRNTVSNRSRFQKRTFMLSAASSIAAAAMVVFVLWIMPGNTSIPQLPFKGNLRLPVPDTAIATAVVEPEQTQQQFNAFSLPASGQSNVIPASYEAVPAAFGNYRVADAFAGPALPESAFAVQNVEMDSGKGWVALAANTAFALAPGMRFRSASGMGHLEFANGSMISLSPDTLVEATRDGFGVNEGFLLVTVPEYSSDRFRLHFPERDIAVEPGTDLAILVEPKGNYAADGAPAPMVMVVDRQDAPSGGLALAKGKNGVAPLFSKQIYRLDNYVTAEIPGRTLCDTECQELEKFYKAETLLYTNPPASMVGGFAGHDRDMSYTTTVLRPAGFSKQGNKWVADTYQGQPTIRMQYLSDAYFGFANERRDLSRELSLGGQVVIDGKDGNFYEIFK